MATDLVTDWTVQWGVAPGRLPSCLQDVTQPEGMREIRNGRDKLGHHRAPDRSRAPLTVLGGRDPASPVPTSAYAVSSPLDSSPPKDRREPCPIPKPFPNVHGAPQGRLCTVGHAGPSSQVDNQKNKDLWSEDTCISIQTANAGNSLG